MKVCCGNGKPYDSLTEAERIGGCVSDHCMGPIEVGDFNILLTPCAWCGSSTEDNCRNKFNCHRNKQSGGWGGD